MNHEIKSGDSYDVDTCNNTSHAMNFQDLILSLEKSAASARSGESV